MIVVLAIFALILIVVIFYINKLFKDKNKILEEELKLKQEKDKYENERRETLKKLIATRE